VIDLLEEAGEVAAAVKGLEGYQPPDKPKTRDMLAAELSDLLYSVFALAEYYEIDLENAFTKTISNYLKKFTKIRANRTLLLFHFVTAAPTIMHTAPVTTIKAVLNKACSKFPKIMAALSPSLT
ncbi:MAG TPA: hypothetical protein ENF63_00625, partial [Candidatus Bathyarchaeota archaeon]|nr:hypothetical protein [Candidatus Bathyarchaeota archaeon]